MSASTSSAAARIWCLAVIAQLGLGTAPLHGQANPAASAVGASPSAAVAPARSYPRGTATAGITLVVALVGQNLSVRPVPLHELHLNPRNGGEPIIVRTGLDGTATLQVPLGDYDVVSATPVVVGGLQYQWALPLAVPSTDPGRIELTNANASTMAATEPVTPSAAPVRARQMAPEMEVYRQVRSGVFRIESGLVHGSGFLVDTLGLILTNAHVVAGQLTAAAVLDSTTRIPLQIVFRDNEADVAVLRAAPSLVRGRPVLTLARTAPLVEPGERIFAIGYPLHQEQTLTSGIVSSVREGAIISDVNINHGNSGGPMLNLAGEVVGINTFGDFTSQGGPGISGAVVISRAIEPLSVAALAAANRGMPDEAPLPMMPTGRFRTQDLVAFADSVSPKQYARFDSIGVGKFYVTLTTPPIAYVRQKAFERVVAKDRKKREARAGLSDEERFSEMRDFRDWQEYVGDQRAPVVAITVEPRVGETTGSVFRRLLVTGAGGKLTVRYSGDLRGAQFLRNGEPMHALKGGTTPVKQYIDNSWVNLKDVANYGYYVLPAEAFAPDADGTPPSIVIELDDLKNPSFPGCRELTRDVVATVWNDFVLYYGSADVPFTRSDPKMKSETAPDKDSVCRLARSLRLAPPIEAVTDSTEAADSIPLILPPEPGIQ